MPYLQFAVNSVLRQGYSDFELLVSLEGSESESEAVKFVAGISDSRLRLLRPVPGLSMTEHWDWLQKAATGEWQIYVGQDDGLQEGFFEIADKLVSIAEASKTRVIASTRAYLHWPGSFFDKDGKGSITRGAKNIVQIRSLQKDTLSALIGWKTYFELPQMYTTSLFHSSLIADCRQAQDGDFLTCHPQDANLAALANAHEKTYVLSGIPLGWVGSSKKSAGLAVSSQTPSDQDFRGKERKLAESYLESVRDSRHSYPAWAGDFSIGNLRIYLWQALIRTKKIQAPGFIRAIEANWFLTLLLARCTIEIPNGRRNSYLSGLRQIGERNEVSLSPLYFFGVAAFSVAAFIHRGKGFLGSIPRRLRLPTSSAFGTSWSRTAAGEPWQELFIRGAVPMPSIKDLELGKKWKPIFSQEKTVNADYPNHIRNDS